MILYRLRCRTGHDFEAWFLDSATFDRQAVAGDVSCPHCGTTRVAKAPMAPRLASGASAGERAGERDAAPAGESPAETRASEVAAKILRAVEGIRDHVEETCDYVSDEFADEARRIKKGEAEERGIYGEATPAEAEELDEEGIKVFRLPFVGRRNKN